MGRAKEGESAIGPAGKVSTGTIGVARGWDQACLEPPSRGVAGGERMTVRALPASYRHRPFGMHSRKEASLAFCTVVVHAIPTCSPHFMTVRSPCPLSTDCTAQPLLETQY